MTSMVLFFTDNMSLQGWSERGVLDRELALYERLVSRGVVCHFVSYGGPRETEYMDHFSNIGVIYNRWKFSRSLYKICMPFMHFQTLLNTELFKAHQVSGALFPVLLKRIFRKKVVVRCGFLPSIFADHGHFDRRHGDKVKGMERYVFEHADGVVVPSESNRDYVIRKYRVSPERVDVIPNYIDTELFKPDAGARPIPNRICTIAKNHPQKNISSLIEAMEGLGDLELVVIGGAYKNAELVKKAQALKVNVTFAGVIANSQLPYELRKSMLYIQTSLYDGPTLKTLLEAMACGVSVIATDVEGIRELVRHEDNGYLCGTSSSDMRDALVRVTRDEALRDKMARQAREWVVARHSLERVVELELNLYRKILNGRGDAGPLRERSRLQVVKETL